MMTPDQDKKIDDLHSFFFEHPAGLPKAPTRAEQIEEILKAYRSASWISRGILYIGAFATAVTAIFAMFFRNGPSP